MAIVSEYRWWYGKAQYPLIHYFHIDHSAPCLPPPPAPQILHNHCFQFLLGITVVPREIQDNSLAKFLGGVNKVHYGL